MMNYRKKLHLILCCLLTLGLLPGCSEKETLEIAPSTAGLQADAGCPEEVSAPWSWEVEPISPPPPYDVILSVSGDIPEPEGECECIEEMVCVTYSFPKLSYSGYHIKIETVSGSTTLTTNYAPLDLSGGYAGFPIPTQLASAMSKLKGTTVTLGDILLTNTLCFPAGDLTTLSIDFGGVFPGEFDPYTAIESVIGLCIVDNLGNGGGDGEGDGGT